MGKVKKQTRKLRQKVKGGHLSRLPKSAAARANKRRRHERDQVAAKAEAMEDEPVIDTGSKPVEDMNIDELLGVEGGDEVTGHAAEMRSLADTDPDFYNHLLKNNPDLLKFGDDDEQEQTDIDDDDDHDDLDDNEDDGDDSENGDADGDSPSVDLTKVVPAQLRSARLQQSQRSLRRLIRLFRVASHMTDADDNNKEDEVERSGADAAVEALHVSDPAAFDRLLRTLFKYIPRLLSEQAGPEPKKSPHWSQLEAMIRSFLGNAIHFLSKCVEPRLLQRALQALGQCQSLFIPFPKLCQRYLKVLLQIWAKAADQARIEAFLQLRALVQALRHRQAFVSAALRGLYGTFVRNAKFLTAVNAPMLRFMQNCIVEVFALDHTAAYQHAFIYIRQIAVRLRASSTQVDAQLVNSVRVWAHVLSRLGGDPRSALRPLCYPFTQIVLALIGSHASNKYFPLHLQCAEMLHQIASVTGQFIPISPPLLGVICATNWVAVGKAEPAKATATAKAPPIETMIAAPNSLLRSKAFQDAVVNRAVVLLRLHLTQHSRSIAFPELGATICRTLNRFASETKIVRFRKLARKLSVQIASNMTFIESRRGECEFSPKDRESIAAWSAALPKTLLEAYSESAGDAQSEPEFMAEHQKDRRCDSDDDQSDDEYCVSDHEGDYENRSIDSSIAGAIAAAEGMDGQDDDSDDHSDAEDVVDDLVISSDDDSENDDSE